MRELLTALARELEAEKHILLGYRDQDLFLQEDLGQYGQVYIATEDGSVGVQGNVMDIIRVNALEADMIMACGPMPMLRAIKKYAAGNSRLYFSGGADGMRRGRLSGVRMQDEGDRFTFSCA